MNRPDRVSKAKRRSNLCLRVFFAIASCCVVLRTANAQTWKLAWSDEFNGSTTA